jgi:hypothetical protein
MSGWFDSNTKGSMGYFTAIEDKREKLQALSLAKECYSMKLDLLTNATVVFDTIRFVSERSKKIDNNQGLEENKKQTEVITNSVF